MAADPALFLLLTVGQLQFWLLPAIAWTLLRRQRDIAADFWFAGTACYAGTATLFAVQSLIEPNWKVPITLIGSALVALMLACMAESLRRELSGGPTPWRWIGLLLAVHVVILMLVEATAGFDAMRVSNLILVSILDFGCCILLAFVIRKRRSPALCFVFVGFFAVLITNLIRVHGHFVHGESVALLRYTPVSNLAFIANYLSVVLYSFGYWGFVIEKNRANLSNETGKRIQAQHGESQALVRESEMKTLIAQRDELIVQLARMQRGVQVGALSASIAHEVSQPLASVRLCVEEAIALRVMGAPLERLDELLKRIAQENSRASKIIQTLRDLFRGQRSEPATCLIDEAAESICELLERRFSELGVRLSLDLRSGARVLIGAGELEHVLLNLLTNALDALGRTLTQDAQVRLSSKVEGSVVVLRVWDNGPGISELMRARLFDLFAGSRDEGLGLGLWLSRYILERRGGQLDLEPSLTTGGTGFIARLPILRSTDGRES